MRKRTDGRYCKQVVVGHRTNGTRIVKSIYGKTIREVEKKERELRNNCELGINIIEENITVEEWANKWLTVYKQNVSHGTYLMYERIIRNHIIPSIGRIPLNKLKPINIQQEINERIEQGKSRTAEIYKLTIKQIIEQAVDEGLIIRNICNSLEKIKSTTEEKRPLTKFEKECISKTQYSDKQRLFLDVLYYLGLRRGEALAISIRDDIDFKNRALTVNHSLDISENTPVLKEPKSKAGYRTLPIPDILFEELVRYIKRYPSIYLFTKSDGGLMTRSAFRRFWDGILKKTEECAEGFREEQHSKMLTEYINTDIGFTPHTFRHTYATNLYYAGIDIKTCQYLLGHSTLEMTLKVYTHLQNSNNTSVAEKINTLFSQSKVC